MDMDVDDPNAMFFILLGHKLYLSPEILKNAPLGVAQVFEHLSQNSAGVLANVKMEDCSFYKFRDPVLLRDEDDDDSLIVRNCLETRSTWTKISPRTKAESLASPEYLNWRYICLAIELPPDKGEKALNRLISSHGTLFHQLQITLTNIESFSEEDVNRNLKNGTFSYHGHPRMEAIAQLELSLAERRRQPVHDTDEKQHIFNLASSYTLFDHFFVEAAQPHDGPGNIREYMAFIEALLSGDDTTRISNEASSALKAGYLSSHFFIPPFFSSQGLDSKTSFKADMPFKFPIFLTEGGEQPVYRTFTPKSDFSVIEKDFLCPFLLCEVISEKSQQDRWRMLLEAIAAARVGYYLQRSHIEDRPFFITAIYLPADLIAERYLVMQINGDQVSIARMDYNLHDPRRRIDFLKEMFNLQDRMEEMAMNFDDAKGYHLRGISNAARGLMSHTESKKKTKSAHKVTSVQEGSGEHGAGDPFTEDSEIVDRLNVMGYEVNMVLFGFQHVATTFLKSNPSDRRFLKLTDRAQEVQILQYLAKIKSPGNHTIPDVQVWVRSSGGFVIHTRSGGAHLTELLQPDDHVWSAATQLVEGVGFMHMHGVAHRDIKPSNVLIPPGGGRLSIIDYSVAVFVKTGTTCHSIVGTEGYMAPEVEEGNVYDPVSADLWSCGKTLEALCSLCKPSVCTVFVLNISKELMNPDPAQRPAMSEVLTRMAAVKPSLSLQPLSLR